MARNTRNALSYMQNTISTAEIRLTEAPCAFFLFFFFLNHPVYSMEYFERGALVEGKR